MDIQRLIDCLSRPGIGTGMKRILLSLIAMAATAVAPILAQDQPGPGPNDQPQQQGPDGQNEQGRGVARISILNGEVSVRRGDSGDVVAAAINGPADGQRQSSYESSISRARKYRLGPGPTRSGWVRTPKVRFSRSGFERLSGSDCGGNGDVSGAASQPGAGGNRYTEAWESIRWGREVIVSAFAMTVRRR